MQSFDLNNIWEHILQEAKKNMQHLPDALYLRVTASLIPMSLDSHSIHIGVMQTFVKNLIDQQPQIARLYRMLLLRLSVPIGIWCYSISIKRV